MSKKKKSTDTATILIRLNGDETTATLIQDEFPTRMIRRTVARRNPTDIYSAYEGARIALARLYDKEPFPKQIDGKDLMAPGTLPGWANNRRFRVGDKAVFNKNACDLSGAYKTGDLAEITEVRPTGYYVRALTGEGTKLYGGGYTCYVMESELDPVADEPEKKPKEAPFTPSFQPGDIVRLNDCPIFAPPYRGHTAVVKSVLPGKQNPGAKWYAYALLLVKTDGTSTQQCCREYPNEKAPIKLLMRGGRMA